MKIIFLLVFSFISFYCQALSINITSPTVAGYEDASVYIRASVGGTYSVDTVWAEIGTKKIGLRYNGSNYVNTLSIADLPEGTLKLTVRAIDVMGTTASASRNFKYDTPPSITITSPVSGNAHLNSLHIKAVASDVGGGDCSIRISGTPISTFVVTNSVDRVVTASRGYSDPSIYYNLTFTVTDPVGQVTTRTVPMYFESSTLLTHIIDTHGTIMDARDNRVLTRTADANNMLIYHIENIADGTRTTLPLPLRTTEASGAELTPDGAILNIGTDLYLWDGTNAVNLSATIDILGSAGYDKEYYVLRSEPSQSQGYRLGITDLRTLDTTAVSPFGVSYGILAQGHRVYYYYRSILYKYDIDTKITTKIDGPFTVAGAIAAEGNLIAYARSASTEYTQALLLSNGQSSQALSVVERNWGGSHGFTFALRDNYVVFEKRDKNRKWQVWRRNPDNSEAQISFFSESSLPAEIGSHGRSFFVNAQTRYYTDPSNSAIAASGELGTVYFIGAKIYLALGRTLFLFDLPEPLPVTWEYFNGKEVPEGNKLSWATSAEQNAENFTVERSTNGRLFEDIATVAAMGNSTKSSQYNYIDNTFQKLNAATVYYRLKQSDFDGKSSYSSIVSIKNEALSELKVDVFPNPFTESISVNVPDNTRLTDKDLIEIYSVDGKLKFRKTLQNTVNNNRIELKQLTGFPQGLYFLRISFQGKSSVVEIAKQ